MVPNAKQIRAYAAAQARKITRKPAPQTVSLKGLELIARFEGFRAYPYNDVANHATIGYGHLLHHGPVTKSDMAKYPKGLSRDEALALLRKDIARFEQAVRKTVKVKLSQNQFDALVSFSFNVGTGALASSTLVRLLNKGDYGCVPGELLKWVNAGGRRVEGLVRRRRVEGQVWSKGEYGG